MFGSDQMSQGSKVRRKKGDRGKTGKMSSEYGAMPDNNATKRGKGRNPN